MSNDPAAAAFNPPPPVTCPYCGDTLYTQGVFFGGRAIWRNHPVLCDCDGAKTERAEIAAAEKRKEEEAAARARAELQEKRQAEADSVSSMGRRFHARRFETFDASGESGKAYRFAKGYSEKFAQFADDTQLQEKNGLFFTGAIGTGKTHLAAAIANALRDHGRAVVFATGIDLLEMIKETFEKGGQERLMRTYKRADLLVIDDLGKEQPTQWALTKLYQIVNARYEDMRPIVVTTNYSREELVKRLTPKGEDSITAAATVDRLLEMCYQVPTEGASHRQK